MSLGDASQQLILDIGDDPVPSDGVILLSGHNRASSRSDNGNTTPRVTTQRGGHIPVTPNPLDDSLAPMANAGGPGGGAPSSRSRSGKGGESKDKRILMSPSLSKSGSKSSKTGGSGGTVAMQHSSSTKSLNNGPAVDTSNMTAAERYKLRHSMRDLTSPHHPRKRTTRKAKGGSDVYNFGNLLNGAGGTAGGSDDDDLERRIANTGGDSDDPDAIELAADAMAREAANEAAGLKRPGTAERDQAARRAKRRTASRAHNGGGMSSGSDGDTADHDSDKEKDTDDNNDNLMINNVKGDGVQSLRRRKKKVDDDDEDEDERKKPHEADILTLHHDNDNDNNDNKSSGTNDEEAALLPGVVADPTMADDDDNNNSDKKTNNNNDTTTASGPMSPPPAGGSRAASMLSPGRGHLSRGSTQHGQGHKQSSTVGREQLGAAVAMADDNDDTGADNNAADISQKETEVDDSDGEDDDDNDQHAAVFQRPGRKSMARKKSMWCARYVPCLRIINPREDFRMGWDIFVMAILVYNLMEIPFRLCFRVPAAPLSPPDIINLLTDIFWMLDVVVHFRTGFYHEDTYIEDPKKIAIAYLRSWAVLDIITSLPAGHIVQAANVAQDVVDGFRAIRLLKLVRFAKLLRTLSQQEVKAGLLADILGAVQFIVLIFIIAHLSACFWFAIAAAEIASDGHLMSPSNPLEMDPLYNNWLAATITRKNASLYYPTVDDMDLTFKYFLSLYWAFATIATVGYGDVTPITQTERIFLCFIMLVGAISFGYTISNVTQMLSLEDDTGRKIRDKISSINQYMHYRKLPDDLQRRIRAHYEYAWKRQTVYDEREILTQLPSFLRTKVALRLNKDLIQNVPFFKDLGNDCLAMLVTELKPLQIPPGTVIFKYGALGREMYFVSEGAVEVLGRKEKVLCTLERGAYFGEYALLSNRPTKRSSTVRSIEFTDLFSLTKTAFDEVLKVYPELHGKIARRAEAQLRALLMTRKTDEEKRKHQHEQKEKRHKAAVERKKAADLAISQQNSSVALVPSLAISDIASAAKKEGDSKGADGKDGKAAAAAESSSSSDSSDDDNDGEFGESGELGSGPPKDESKGGTEEVGDDGKVKKKKKPKKQRTPGREKISARTRHLFRETKRLSMATIPNMSAMHASRPSMSSGPGGAPVLDKRSSLTGAMPMLARRGSVVPGATAGDIPLLGDIPVSAAAVHAAHMHHMSVHLQGGAHQGQGSPGRSAARTEEDDAEFWKLIEAATSTAFQQLSDKRKQHEQRQERLEKNVSSLTAALAAVSQSINVVRNARMVASMSPTTHTITTTTTTTPHANTVQVSTHLHRSQASTGGIILVPGP